MAGKQGQRSQKDTEIVALYDAEFMSQLDGRVKVARTLRQRLGALTNDLGGLANLSFQEQCICKRVVHLERLIEKKEMALAHNRKVDEGCYYAAITTLSALLSKVGLKRRPKLVSTLAEVLNQQESAS